MVSQRTKSGYGSRCKQCNADYMRKFSRENRDVINKRVLAYHHRNREQKNKERKIRYENNKAHHTDLSKKWKKANPDLVSIYGRNDRHRRRQHLKQSNYLITPKEINKILANNCFYCESKGSMTLDHVVPISRNGLHKIGNLVAACKSCNSSKGNKTIMEWKMRKLFITNKRKF